MRQQKESVINMQLIRMNETGGPEVMRLEEAPTPEPGPGQARIKIEAAGVNFADIYVRTGVYQRPLPLALGSEAAGVIDALGPSADDTGDAGEADPTLAALTVGARVATVDAPGAYAQYAIVPVQRLVAIPDGVDTHTAAAVMLQGMTAHYLTHSLYAPKADDTVLIHAGAGGVGQLLTQIVKFSGAQVIATVSTEEKAQLARQAGADHTILYTQEDFVPETKRITNDRGVAAVYDGVGKQTFLADMNALHTRGWLILFGQSSGAVAPLDPQMLNAKGSLILTRPTLVHYVADRAELTQRAGDLFRWIAAGKLRVTIDRTWPLAQAADAHRYMEGRHTHGKILLLPWA